MNDSHTLTIAIERPADELYSYLCQPARFPEWSAFITRMEPEGEGWLATTAQGEVRIRFAPRNEFRVLDHYVAVSPELEVYVPMLVLENGRFGSEVLFTVFRLPGMTDEQFEEDVRAVRADLESLKKVVEKG